jgi:hypothetical protein
VGRSSTRKSLGVYMAGSGGCWVDDTLQLAEFGF